MREVKKCGNFSIKIKDYILDYKSIFTILLNTNTI